MNLSRSLWFGVRAVVILALLTIPAHVQDTGNAPQFAFGASLSGGGKSLPLGFEKNEGQTGPQVKYLARGRGYGLFLTPAEAVLALHGPDLSASGRASAHQTAVRLQMIGANPDPFISGEDLLPGKSNYFIGNDSAKWRTNVSQYARVRHRGVYPGIDLVYYGNQGQLEFDLVVAPGADPNRVRFKFAGADKLELNSQGDLIVRVHGGELSLRKPVIYQVTAEGKKSIDGRYVLAAGGLVGLRVDRYDRSRELVLDPTLEYATFLGGTGSDTASGIAVDSSGNAYVAGNTSSTDFPTASPFQSSGNLLVSKLNATGTALIYSTYFGGPTSGFNSLQGLAIDATGNVYVTGSAGTGFPTVNQISSACDLSCQNGSGAYVAKINATGSALDYASRLGLGSTGEAIAVDSAGNAYVAGKAANSDFPTVNAFQSALAGSTNGFLLKVNAAGSALIYSTFLGGSGVDIATGVAVDSSGSAYVAGTTKSPNFPAKNQIPGACVGTCGTGANHDAFVTKFSADGATLLYSSLIGGSGEDSAAPDTLFNSLNFGHAITVDSTGSAYVGGVTSPVGPFVLTNPSTTNDFPTTSGAFQTSPMCSSTCADGFVTKINAAGTALSFSTFFGTSPSRVNAIAVDSSGNVAALGLFVVPFTNPVYQNGGTSSGVGLLNPTGSTLLFSTTQGVGIGGSFDSAGDLYVGGFTCGNGIGPTSGAFQTACKSSTGNNAFVAKIALSGSNSAPVVSFSPAGLTFPSQTVGTSSAAQNITLSNTGNALLDIAGITITGADASDYSETNTCGTSVAAGANCTVSVTFKPTTAGTRTASVSVADNASGSPQSVALTGTGSASTAPAVRLSPVSLTFTSQRVGTSSPAQAVTLTNSGNATLNISGVTITGTNTSDFSETNTCGTTVAASGNCVINVMFKPTTTGTRTALVSIADNASGSPQTVMLSGTGAAAAAPGVTLAPTSLTFASQTVGTSSAAQSITLTNSGNATLNISGVSTTGTNAGDYSETNTCAATLAAGANCAISVTFKPAAAGTRMASVSIADNASGSPQTVSLSGTAVTPDFSLTANPSSLTVNAGQSATDTISVVPANGFNQSVSLSCSGLPSGVTCKFSQGSVTPSGGPVSSTLTLAADSSVAFAPGPIRFRPGPVPAGGVSFALTALLAVLFLGVAHRQMPRVRRLSVVAGLVVLGSVGLLTGCAGGGKAPLNATVTVSGTSGSGAAVITHTATINLTVKR